MYNELSRYIPDNAFTLDYRKNFEKMAEEYRKQPIIVPPYSLFKLFQETGSRVEYEAVYFDIRKRCDIFAILMLSGKNEYKEDLEDTLFAICDEFTWALPAHLYSHWSIDEKVTRIDLFASETAYMLSTIWYLLKDELSKEVADRIEYELRRRIIAPYMKNHPRWEKSNWSAVTSCNVFHTMVYLGCDEELKEAIPCLQTNAEDFLESYQDDGCCMEGTMYWSYGFEHFCFFANLLRQYTHGEIDYFKNEKVRRMARYGFVAFFDENMTLPFSDSPHRFNYNIGFYHFLKKEYPELPLPDATFAQHFGDEKRHRFAEILVSLYWYDPALTGKQTFTDNVDFPLSQVYIRNRDNYHFACKGGFNDEPHNHDDVGNLIFIKDKTFILDDAGWPEYDKWYIGTEKRYTDYICSMSEGHTVPFVNGKPQKWGREYHGDVLKAEADEIIIDLSNAYAQDGVSIVRTMTLQAEGIKITDVFTGAETVTERFITREIPEIINDREVKIGSCILRSETAKPVKISSADYTPRGVSHIGMKDLETLYMIDFLPDNVNEAQIFTVE